MTGFPISAIALALVAPAAASMPVQYTQNSPNSEVAGPSYADVANLVLQSPLIIDGTIYSTVRIKGAEAATVPAGYTRFYVQLDVNALIRGESALAPRIGYVVDVPLEADGRPPKLRKLRMLVFARPVPGMPDQVQLVRRDGQRLWSPALDQRTRAVVKELLGADPAPAITSVGNAFYVPGTLPGEGETQIFLNTSTGAPISLSILRRPNQAKQWSVALGDIVGDANKPPQRDTLLWYRLACGLPRTLPDSSVADQTPENAQEARADYQFVLQSLGPCQ